MSTKTPDEIRDLFSAALENELSPGDKEAFDAALAESAELKDEYEAFRTLFRGTAAIAETTDAETDAKEPALLPRVQERIHKRSKGRFFKDRFSRDAGRSNATWLLLILISLVLLFAIVTLRNLVEIEPSGPPPAPLPAQSADS